MTLTKLTSTQGDGRVTHEFVHDGDPTETVLFTGPIFGRVELADGTSVSVNDDYIAVPTDQVGEVMHEIGLRHERDGHPMHFEDGPDGPLGLPFVHLCTEHCGDVGRSAAQIVAAYDEGLTRTGNGHLIGSTEHKKFVAQIKAQHADVNKRLAEAARNG